MKSLLVFGLFGFMLSTTCFGQEQYKHVPKELTPKEQRELARTAKKPPSGAGFYIGPIEGGKGLFSVLLTDANGQSVSGSFTLQQVEVFEAVLEASKAFALTDEKVGSGKPIITRLMEQHEWSLFVDVSKIGDESRFYVSLVTPTGKLTTEAGQINRASKKPPSALLLKMVSQIQEAKAAARPLQ
ncbi:MAG: hypothetical protein DMF60_07205 [Acidobacteria bacterium]|nr:MAG: hypothetical protein DMF60_07205 [Acidobacteriota bacterium]